MRARIEKAIEEAKKVWWEKEKALVLEQVQRGRDDGYSRGYEAGVRDATRSLKEDSFSDLHLAWREIQEAHTKASSYAGVVAAMYNSARGKAEASKKETEGG